MSQDRVEIRDIRPADERRLRSIQRAVLDHPSPQLLTAAASGLGIGLVADADERTFGYVFAFVGDDTAYVPEIAVDASRHRQGIGSALLETLMQRAGEAGVAELRLTVRAADERARSFYRGHGFEERERLSEYYETTPTTGIVLARSV